MGKKIKLAYVIILLFLWNCAGTHQRKINVIRLRGSDTLLLLTTRWAEEYMKLHPATSVYVDGGGSALGFKSLIKGEIDICAASRPMQANEARQLAEKYQKIGMGFWVAKDALSIYLNPTNPVKNLTSLQVKAIFTGEITNWERVGGDKIPIKVIIRSPNSGTYLYFKDHVLNGEQYALATQTMATTAAVVKTVSENDGAVGYGGIAYGQQVIHCKINNIEPSEENVRNDTYPIIRYLYLYTIDTPQGEVKAFIDWVLKDGQKFVKQVGYIPLWEVKD